MGNVWTRGKKKILHYPSSGDLLLKRVQVLQKNSKTPQLGFVKND
jgi:hypothetical protein